MPYTERKPQTSSISNSLEHFTNFQVEFILQFLVNCLKFTS